MLRASAIKHLFYFVGMTLLYNATLLHDKLGKTVACKKLPGLSKDGPILQLPGNNKVCHVDLTAFN